MVCPRKLVLLALCLFWMAVADCPAAEPPPDPLDERGTEERPLGVVRDIGRLAVAAATSRRDAASRGQLRPPVSPELTRLVDTDDPLFPSQWYLHSVGQDPCQPYFACGFSSLPGLDIDVLDVWRDYTGAGVRVALQEAGAELDHPDLTANVDTALGDGPGGSADHGTPVLGVTGAVADNALGVAGVAPGAGVARIDFFGYEEPPPQHLVDNADVVSRSGSGFMPVQKRHFGLYGRGGLGTISVNSAGNGRAQTWHANFDPSRSSRYGIVAAAASPFGGYTYYSNPGSTVLVTAPGEYIMTTVPRGTGFDASDYGLFSGTSAAAPVVAGVVALMLEANPQLGHRDVQEILALSARQLDASATGWASNGATTWNGGGSRVNLDYGFGLVDAHAAVRLAETWPYQRTLADESLVESVSVVEQAIGEGAILNTSTTVTEDLEIDWVEIRLDMTPRIGNGTSWEPTPVEDVEIRLVSPAGAESVVLTRLDGLHETVWVGFEADDPLQTGFHRGESSVGEWTLEIRDFGVDGVSATLHSWTLSIYGDPASDDDLYVLTEDFPALVAAEPSRAVLVDTSGRDRIDTSAIHGSVDVDLSSREISIGDSVMTLDGATRIEEIFAGDGDDILVGSATGTLFHGGRGNDVMIGQGAEDVALYLGVRADYLVEPDSGGIYRVRDLAPERAGDEDDDILYGVQIARFADGDLALPPVPELFVPHVTVAAGSPVTVPIYASTAGLDLISAAFSLDIETECLVFDPADSNGDGLPDAVVSRLPASYSVEVRYDPNDSDGELDVLLFDLPPAAPLTSGILVELVLDVVCVPDGVSRSSPIEFSNQPAASFGDSLGQGVAALTAGASVEIVAGTRGDCNGSLAVDAGDIGALGLELFDGDGAHWADVRFGSFAGLPVGCDANADTTVDAGDVSCTGLLIFEPEAACASGGSRGLREPELVATAPATVATGDAAALRVRLDPGEQLVNAVAFTLRLPVGLELDGADDGDGDGLPDAVELVATAGVARATWDGARRTLGVLLARLESPTSFPVGDLLAVRVDVATGGTVDLVDPSFGDLDGRAIPGSARGILLAPGALFGDGFESGDTSAWSPGL